MPAVIKARTAKHLAVLGFLFPCDGWRIRRVEADNYNVVVDAGLHRDPAQTRDRLPHAHRAKAGTLEVHQFQHYRLLAEVSAERHGLPVLVIEHQIEWNGRVELLFQVDALR